MVVLSAIGLPLLLTLLLLLLLLLLWWNVGIAAAAIATAAAATSRLLLPTVSAWHPDTRCWAACLPARMVEGASDGGPRLLLGHRGLGTKHPRFGAGKRTPNAQRVRYLGSKGHSNLWLPSH